MPKRHHCADQLAKSADIMKGGADWGPYAQAIIGSFLIVLALELAVEGYRTIFKKKDPDDNGEAPALD